MKKAQDNRTIDDFINDLFEILCLPNLHRHTRRAILYKAIEDYSKILVRDNKTFWSVNARESWDKRIPTKLVLEHPVPKSIITRRITPETGNGPTGEQLRDDLSRAFKELIPICWVLKEEDRKLRDANLKSDMPGDPSWESIDPWSRYKHESVMISIVNGYPNKDSR